jgi:16S rRNA (cytosine967-C5)-methyltransferase
MSTLWPAEERLRSVDWSPLQRLRAEVVEALGPVLAGADAARALARLLRRQPSLSRPERAAVAEALLGVALWRRRLRHQSAEDSPSSLLDTLVREPGREPESETHAPLDWPTRLSYPDWLAAALSRALGAEAEAFAAASNLPGPVTVRANGLRLSREALQQRLLGEGVKAVPTAHAPDGLFLADRPNILGLPSHQAGLFEVQDEGSQLAGLCVRARPGDQVLDICAGSGGKTLLLGAAINDNGRLYAYDIDALALERLSHRAARAGLRSSLRVLHALPVGLRASHVLVDAPCTALGTLRRGPDARWRLEEASLSAFPPLQRELLEAGAAHTAPGGRLVYATCTVRAEENQDVVRGFLAVHRDFAREPAPVPAELRSADGDLLTLPHRQGMDGFYAAVLVRRGS